MSPTSWTEATVPAGGFQEGISANLVDDYFTVFLFDGALSFAVMPWSGTEKSVPVTAYIEKSTPQTPWTERAG
jgi:hypothetical protein